MKNEDERKRRVLVDFYAEAKDFLDTIDEQLLNLLQKHVGNVEENMTNHTAQLEQKEYFLLVAGRNVGLTHCPLLSSKHPVMLNKTKHELNSVEFVIRRSADLIFVA